MKWPNIVTSPNGTPRPLWVRLLWMAGIWTASVLVLLVIAWLLRQVLHP